jgi:hypothetical protein
MKTPYLEEINAEMDNSHIQHYISSLHGCLNAGEAVLLDTEVQVTDSLCSKVVMILQKQQSPSFGFLVNFHVFLRCNG